MKRFKMNVLVIGGAGYVGSIVSEELINIGHDVTVIDNLQQGHQQAVVPEAEFIIADICDAKVLEDIFRNRKIDAVMHMAAETVVEFSMTDPRRYFHGNVIGGLNVLDTMLKYDTYNIIFSSSAAIYGEPQHTPIEESHPKSPVNSYGESKLIFEQMLHWYGIAYGLKHLSFRYFNAAGASRRLGEAHHPETHIIPLVLNAALRDQGTVSIFGDDYPTRDGTCVRDYVHVKDIAQAHILALEKMEEHSGKGYNLGNGEGYSVKEVVETARRITGKSIPAKILGRRPGDPAILVASSNLVKAELGWEPKFTRLDDIIESAWNWMQQHPNGYTD